MFACPKLMDVVGWKQAEHMLEQHDRYEFGRIAVARRNDRKWYVYFGHLEVVSLAEALETALSPANQKRWEQRYTERFGVDNRA